MRNAWVQVGGPLPLSPPSNAQCPGCAHSAWVPAQATHYLRAQQEFSEAFISGAAGEVSDRIRLIRLVGVVAMASVTVSSQAFKLIHYCIDARSLAAMKPYPPAAAQCQAAPGGCCMLSVQMI